MKWKLIKRFLLSLIFRPETREERIERMELQPGDALVLIPERAMRAEDVDHVARYLERRGVQLVVFPPGSQVKVVQLPESSQLAAHDAIDSILRDTPAQPGEKPFSKVSYSSEDKTRGKITTRDGAEYDFDLGDENRVAAIEARTGTFSGVIGETGNFGGLGSLGARDGVEAGTFTGELRATQSGFTAPTLEALDRTAGNVAWMRAHAAMEDPADDVETVLHQIANEDVRAGVERNEKFIDGVGVSDVGYFMVQIGQQNTLEDRTYFVQSVLDVEGWRAIGGASGMAGTGWHRIKADNLKHATSIALIMAQAKNKQGGATEQ